MDCDNLNKAEVDIKIELSNDYDAEGGLKDESKETLNITEKIKKVIEESFGRNCDKSDLKTVEKSDHSKGVKTSHEASSAAVSIKIETSDSEHIQQAAELAENDVIKLDDSNMSNIDYDDIADSEDEQEALELEELTGDATNINLSKSVEDRKEIEEKLKLLTVETEKLRGLPVPKVNSSFQEFVQAAFCKFLPGSILSSMTPGSCGLCHEDFTSEGYAWKHYTGFNHKRTVKYFINGTYKDHPSFYNMVLDTIYRKFPKALSENDIFISIKKEHPTLGVDDEIARKLIRQKGLSKLLKIEYVVKKDGKYTATQALMNRKKRSKELRDKIKTKEGPASLKYPEPVKLQDSSNSDEKFRSPELLNQDLTQFKDQIHDFSKSFLPTSVISTLTQEHCGLCKLDIFCKPWSHYTGAGHRTTVELYQAGTYLGHPPYPTMVERYIKEMKPSTLDNKEVIKYLTKNYNVGDDMEKVEARVEKCVEMLGRKNPALVNIKTTPKDETKFPSESLIWFKKDLSKEFKMSNVEKDKQVKEDRTVNDLRITLSCRKDSSKDHKSSAGRLDDYKDTSRDRIRRPEKHFDYTPASRSYDRSGNRRSGKDSKYPSSRVERKKSSPERHRYRTPVKRSSYERVRYSRSPGYHKNSSKRNSRSPDRRQDQAIKSPRRKRRSSGSPSRQRRSSGSPSRQRRSSGSHHDQSRSFKEDVKRSRRSSGSRGDAVRETHRHPLKSSKEAGGRSSKYSHSQDYPKVKESSSHQSKVSRHFTTSQASRQELPVQSALHRPGSGGGDPLPTPPPDLLLPTSSTQSFPHSFLTQHPQFPHVFILNPMASQMGGQIMMPMSLGQQNQPPNQPPL